MPAVRLGLRMVSGLAEHDGRSVAEAVAAMRADGGVVGGGAGDPPGIERLWRASGCGVRALRCLASADALAGMGIDRQQALWQVRALRERPEPVLEAAAGDGATLFDAVPQPLPPVGALRAVAADYASTGLSLRAHPISFLRESLARRGAIECARLAGFRTAMVGGLVLCRQRPATASGIVFMTLEDETGVANLIIRPRAWERCRRIGRHAGAILAEGRVEHRDGVTHLLVRRMADLGPELARRADGTAPAQRSRDFR
jgi:error-prone DNA polymerase